MKIKGKILSPLFEKVLVLPRADRIIDGVQQEDIVLRFRPIDSWDSFNKLCPEPPIVMITFAGQAPRPCAPGEDIDYDKAINTHNRLQAKWLVINSILATPDLEFETVDLNKPETWDQFDTELLAAGFNIFEIQEIYKKATETNVLTEEALEAAKQRFLAAELDRTNRVRSLAVVRQNMASGAPASA